VLSLLDELQRDLGLTYLFISHDLAVVRHMCDRIAVMEGGRIIELGDPESMYENPQQPFTKKLLAAAYLELPNREGAGADLRAGLDDREESAR
jgi:ABC-type oligopeptide transport system ATPase subunit